MYGENRFFQDYYNFIVEDYKDKTEVVILFGYVNRYGVIKQIRKHSPPVCRRQIYTYFRKNVTAVIKEYLAMDKGRKFSFVLFSER